MRYLPEQELSCCRESARRPSHSPSRDKRRTDGVVTAIVAFNKVKCDLKMYNSKVFSVTKMLVHGTKAHQDIIFLRLKTRRIVVVRDGLNR